MKKIIILSLILSACVQSSYNHEEYKSEIQKACEADELQRQEEEQKEEQQSKNLKKKYICYKWRFASRMYKYETKTLTSCGKKLGEYQGMKFLNDIQADEETGAWNDLFDYEKAICIKAAQDTKLSYKQQESYCHSRAVGIANIVQSQCSANPKLTKEKFDDIQKNWDK